MIDDLNDLLAATPDELGLVVHVGAGIGREFRRYIDLGAERILLVEPNTELHEQLRKRTRQHSEVTLSSLAVAPESGSMSLQITSNFRLSSVLEPGALADYFPNVSVVSRRPVRAVDLQELLAGLDFSDQRLNLLVLEMPGVAEATLAAARPELLRAFGRILVRRSDPPLYGATADGSSDHLLRQLQRAGYSRLTLAESAPPFLIDVYQLNDQVARLADAHTDSQEQLRRATENLRAGRVLMNERASEISGLKLAAREQERVLSNVQADLEQREDELRDARLKLTALSDRLAARDDALAKATYRQRQVEANLKEAEEGRSRAENSLAQEQSRLVALNTVLEGERQQAREQEQRLHSLEAEGRALSDQQQSRLAHLEAQLAEQAERLADAGRLQESLAERDRQASEAEAQLEALQSEQADFRQNRQLLEEEVRKAEIQIDLLADVLLRDRSV